MHLLDANETQMVQRVPRSPKARPRFIEPIACKRVSKVPEGDDREWQDIARDASHETKPEKLTDELNDVMGGRHEYFQHRQEDEENSDNQSEHAA
jgi:hypothetical protein